VVVLAGQAPSRSAAPTRPLRVLHCPSLIGGNPGQLAKAEREIGLDSRCVALTGSAYEYEADEILVPREAGFLRREAARWRLLWRALHWADIVHFNFGSTIMPRRATIEEGLSGASQPARALAWHAYARLLAQRDLPALRAAGKVLAMTYQGNDARQRDVSLERFELAAAQEVDDRYYPPGSDALKRAAIETVDRRVDLIYALNPDLLLVLPPRAQFQPYANVDPRGLQATPPNDPALPPVVAHAPTHRGGKGTRFLLAALDRLRHEGVKFELRLIEGVGNWEARELLARADLVVDQLLVGWYGGVGVEAMALGRPVVSYIRPEDLVHLPKGMRDELPLISASPQTIEATLRELLTERRGELAILGTRSRAYVERWHDPRRIAERLRADYERCHMRRRIRPTRGASRPA
jgi:glycosyltransferase involved in cell wall biosynthesis